MVIVSILPCAEIGPNDHREEAPHFIGQEFKVSGRISDSDKSVGEQIILMSVLSLKRKLFQRFYPLEFKM